MWCEAVGMHCFIRYLLSPPSLLSDAPLYPHPPQVSSRLYIKLPFTRQQNKEHLGKISIFEWAKLTWAFQYNYMFKPLGIGGEWCCSMTHRTNGTTITIINCKNLQSTQSSDLKKNILCFWNTINLFSVLHISDFPHLTLFVGQ